MPSPLRALPEAAAETGGLTVMPDAGIRRGADGLKALCLGARCGFVGHPFLCAAALGGVPGMLYAAALPGADLKHNMAMLRVTRLDPFGSERLRRIR